MEPEESEPGEESEAKLDKEEHEEEDNQKHNPPTLYGEGEVHSSGYNLRKREPINYGKARKYKIKATVLYQYGGVSEMNDEILKRLDEEKVLEPKDMFKRCVGICMNQMSAKAGIKKHGEEAVSAILKEFGQL